MSSLWIKASEKMPNENGEYLVVIEAANDLRFVELCDYSKKDNTFCSWWDYEDTMIFYKQKDVVAWMKVPDYEKLEK